MNKRIFCSLFCLSFSLVTFANAPVSTLTIGSADSDTQAATSAPPATQSTVTVASPQAPVPNVVNSQAVLSSLTPDQRIARLENQVQFLNAYTNQINSLNTQVDVLRGQIEDLNHQIAEQQKQITCLNASLANLSKTTAADSKSPSTLNVAQPSKAEQTAYQNAYNLMAKKQYASATTAFNAFLKKYPKSTLIDNTHYWLGDLYLAQGQPDSASKEYRTVINDQNASKRPDAMVKLGVILSAYGDNQHAKELFQNVIKQYPNTSAATEAKKQLKSLQ